jgi:hypothetical protein
MISSGCQKHSHDLVQAPGLFAINQTSQDVASKAEKYTKLHEAGACARENLRCAGVVPEMTLFGWLGFASRWWHT